MKAVISLFLFCGARNLTQDLILDHLVTPLAPKDILLLVWYSGIEPQALPHNRQILYPWLYP